MNHKHQACFEISLQTKNPKGKRIARPLHFPPHAFYKRQYNLAFKLMKITVRTAS